MSDLLLPGLSKVQVDRLERQMREFIANRELPLYRMMAYQMGWVDERGEPSVIGEGPIDRLHGQFLMAVAGALTGNSEDAAAYALSVEFAHNAALIHEDVEDGNTDRGGRPSVWWAWGPAQAINAGDGMQAMARLSLFSMVLGTATPERVSAALAALDDAVLGRCEGEYLDITYQERLTLTPDQYFEMAEGRTGSLLGGAAALGAIASSSDEPVVAALNMFGRKLGAASQVFTDLQALWGERDQASQGRLIAKKKNLGIVYALENGDATLRRKLGELYMQRVLDPTVIDEAARLAESAGGLEFCRQSVSRLTDEAIAQLSAAPLDDPKREQLLQCAYAVTKASEGPD